MRVIICVFAFLAMHAGGAYAQTEGGAEAAGPLAITMFFAIILATLVITAWAARRTRSAHEFYAAGSSISGLQNGFAISGDFMSAGTFLGMTGLVYMAGFDVIIYVLAPMAGLAFILFLLAERLRSLGRFTFADVLSWRLEERPVRAFAAVGGLAVSLLYLIAQIVGAGTLVQILFGIPYAWSVIIVGGLMVVYVSFGGMLATTWVQITKAFLLVGGVVFMAIALLVYFKFDVAALYTAAAANHPLGADLFAPGGLYKDPLSAFSLAVALIFGMAGLPHILMRFFTVPNIYEARRSVFYATGIIGLVFILIFFLIAIGTIALVMNNPEFLGPDGVVRGGGNMVAIHLAGVLGGEILFGVMSAIAFATILAVVAGLTLASAATISHDLYANIFRKDRAAEREEVLVSRLAAFGVGVTAILLGIAFEGQNIIYLIALGFAIAASANFPVLLLSLYWPGLTTLGAVVGGGVGLVTSTAMVVTGPTVWVEVIGFSEPIFPYAYPAAFSLPLALATIFIVSKLDPAGRRDGPRDLRY